MGAWLFAFLLLNQSRGVDSGCCGSRRGNMLTTVLIIILILILLGAFPAWPHSRSWGYGPSGIVGLILVILLILVLLGKV